MDMDKARRLADKEIASRQRKLERKKTTSKGVPSNQGTENPTQKTISELQIELQAAQARALDRIFRAKGMADEVRQDDYFDKRINKVMSGSQKNRVWAEEKYERMMSEVQAAKTELEEAGRVYAEAVIERATWLEEELFGDARGVDLAVRLVITEKSPEQLHKLLSQAEDSSDEELSDLVFLAAHVNDYPDVRLAYFRMFDGGEDELQTADLYDELVNQVPDELELSRLMSEEYWSGIADPALRLLPTLEDLASQPASPPILLR
jgi:hypothetical protein